MRLNLRSRLARPEPTFHGTDHLRDESGRHSHNAESPTSKENSIERAKATEDLSGIEKSHQWDPNLPQDKIDAVHDALKSHDLETIREVDHKFTDDSPYEEVRAAVRNTDGEELANTVRAWILGFIFVTVCSALNMFLSMRNPAISFPSIIVVLLVYPIGCLWAKFVPMRVFTTFGIRWSFNTGPFTIKEHTVIAVSRTKESIEC